jgi:dUTP pyrophosphatase
VTAEIFIERLAHAQDLPLPYYATPASAGMDLRAAIDTTIELAPGGRALIPTGIRIALEVDHEAQVRPRSGLALKQGLTVLNTPGTIDADYRGEIGVILINHGNAPAAINRGDRIAQLVIAPIARITWREEPLDETVRGASGFGSTGTEG